MISRVPEEKPCKARGRETLRVCDKGHTTTHPVSGWGRVTLEGDAAPEWTVQLQWYSPCKEHNYLGVIILVPSEAHVIKYTNLSTIQVPPYWHGYFLTLSGDGWGDSAGSDPDKSHHCWETVTEVL